MTAPGLIVYRYGADLFYANADRFVDQVRELIEKAPTPVQWLIVDAEAIEDIDLSAAQTLRGLLEDLSRKGVRVVFGRVNRYLLADMHGTASPRSSARGNFPDATRGDRRRPRRGRPFGRSSAVQGRAGISCGGDFRFHWVRC